MALRHDAVAGLGRPRVVVLGDIMLDRYTWGSAERISPEAPVMVLESQGCDLRLGGAGAVGALLCGMDADVVAVVELLGDLLANACLLWIGPAN